VEPTASDGRGWNGPCGPTACWKALDQGVQGQGKWFSLIDKVWLDRNLQQAWAKVQSNAGGCGVDGITVARFAKDSLVVCST